MKNNRTRIDDMREAFDEVIPGYVNAWNKAMLDEEGSLRTNEHRLLLLDKRQHRVRTPVPNRS